MSAHTRRVGSAFLDEASLSTQIAERLLFVFEQRRLLLATTSGGRSWLRDFVPLVDGRSAAEVVEAETSDSRMAE